MYTANVNTLCKQIALVGQVWTYYWLELPYSKLPAITVHGVSVNFVIKYPMMLVGTLAVMSAFALAFRIQEGRITDQVAEHALSGD